LLTYYDKAYLQSINKRKTRIKLSLPWDGLDGKHYAEKLINGVAN
jgi:hypothetical protein